MYSIGDPNDPTDDDPKFDTIAAAEIAAIEASWNDSVHAVWDDETGEVMSLVFQQQVFS